MLARRQSQRALLPRFQADGDSTPVVAVVGFGDDRIAERSAARTARSPSAPAPAGHRQAAVRQNLVGLLLVLRELDRNVAGAARDGRLDAC